MRTLLAMFFVATTLCLASCGKDDDKDSTPEPATGISLAGTSWEGTIDTNFTYNNVNMNVDALMTIDFNSDLDGELFMDVTIEVPAMPAANQHQTMTEAFTYHFDGSQCVLTSKDEGAEEGDDGTLTYHPDSQTFSMPVDDAETAQFLGDEMIFHLVRGTLNF